MQLFAVSGGGCCCYSMIEGIKNQLSSLSSFSTAVKASLAGRRCRAGASSSCLPSAFQQLLLAGDIAAVTLGQHVLAHGLDGLAGDDLAADGGLHRDLEQGAGNVIPQLFADAAALGVGVVPEHDHGERVHRVTIQQEVQLDQIALAVLLELVVVAGVTTAAALDGIEEVVDDLAQRQGVVQVHADIVRYFMSMSTPRFCWHRSIRHPRNRWGCKGGHPQKALPA